MGTRQLPRKRGAAQPDGPRDLRGHDARNQKGALRRWSRPTGRRLLRRKARAARRTRTGKVITVEYGIHHLISFDSYLEFQLLYYMDLRQSHDYDDLGFCWHSATVCSKYAARVTLVAIIR